MGLKAFGALHAQRAQHPPKRIKVFKRKGTLQLAPDMRRRCPCGTISVGCVAMGIKKTYKTQL